MLHESGNQMTKILQQLLDDLGELSALRPCQQHIRPGVSTATASIRHYSAV
jgi:hypothetical protein